MSPRPNLGEVAFYNQTLRKLNNGVADNLDGSTGPYGPGDMTFALQWDATMAAGDSLQISKVKSLQIFFAPEPTSSSRALIGVGLLAGRRLVKKQRRFRY